MTRRSRATSLEVARAAGVSQATVSRAFAGGKVSADVRARIVAIADELNYRPNAVARSLTRGRSQLIGLIVSDQTSLTYPELVYELTERLADRGYRVLLFTTSDRRGEAHVLNEIWSHRVDGVLSLAPLSAEHLAQLTRHHLPVVLYNQAGGRGASNVYCDHREAGEQLAARLLAAGERAFGVLAGPPTSFVSSQFLLGLRNGLGDAAARVAVAQGPYRYDFAEAGLARIVADLGEVPDTVICVNDTVAAGCLDELRLKRGLRVPADVSVVALNGRGPSLWAGYAITALRQPTERMAEAAVELLLQGIIEPSRPPEHRVFFLSAFRGDTATVELA